jgi:hypothetical protein
LPSNDTLFKGLISSEYRGNRERQDETNYYLVKNGEEGKKTGIFSEEKKRELLIVSYFPRSINRLVSL